MNQYGLLDTSYIVETSTGLVGLDLFVIENEGFPTDLGIPDDKVHHALIFRDYPDKPLLDCFKDCGFDKIRHDYGEDLQMIKIDDFKKIIESKISSELTYSLESYKIVKYQGEYRRVADLLDLVDPSDIREMESLIAVEVPKNLAYLMTRWQPNKIDVASAREGFDYYAHTGIESALMCIDLNINCSASDQIN